MKVLSQREEKEDENVKSIGILSDRELSKLKKDNGNTYLVIQNLRSGREQVILETQKYVRILTRKGILYKQDFGEDRSQLREYKNNKWRKLFDLDVDGELIIDENGALYKNKQGIFTLDLEKKNKKQIKRRY